MDAFIGETYQRRKRRNSAEGTLAGAVETETNSVPVAGSVFVAGQDTTIVPVG